MEKMDLAAIIQYSLTPGVMISSSALFLLGLQTRFSNLFARFRALNQERRQLDAAHRSESDNVRLKSLVQQLDRILKRVSYVKNAIFCFYFAILCFAGNVIVLFLMKFTNGALTQAGFIAFLGGMFFIFVAVVFLLAEVTLAVHILQIERRT